jgi:predicted nuclease of predicted toxin-antitoxin system
MKLLLDQGLPRASAALMRAVQIDAVHTGEVGLATASDEVIVDQARLEGRTIVTLDADFHALLALSGSSSPSVIRIRIEGLKARRTADLLLAVMRDWTMELDQGAVLTVQPGRVRFRLLPILGA